MESFETRAGDLLDRLIDCGIGGGLTEEDLFGEATREPLRTCCNALAVKLWALVQYLDYGDLRVVHGAITDLRQAASSEQEAGGGRLSVTLSRLCQVLDSSYTPSSQPPSMTRPPDAGGSGHSVQGSTSTGSSSSRLEALELLVATLQGATLMAAAQRAQQQGAAGAGAAPTAGAGAAEQEGEGEGEAEMCDPLMVEISRGLRGLESLLDIPRPPGGGFREATPLVAAVRGAVEALLGQLPPGFFEPLLPKGSLSPEQLSTLGDVNAALHDEYALRRRMLIERAKVTLQSFLWSGRLEEKGTKAQAAAVVEAAEKLMEREPAVAQADVFNTTAGDLLTIMERATSGDSGVEASVKAVLIGAVPDRGGRTEGRARAADMPAWAPRRTTGGGEEG